ncbi:MAG: type III pantothenate kinase, partial [Myxococcota bacterium]|nr:type III pantothenate kinase [Myxococcota bacterium]
TVRASLGVRCEEAIRRWLGCRVETIRVHPTEPLRLSYADQELGVDRWVNAVAALEYFPDGEAFALIADLGSATTIDAISASGELLGGVILPGPEAFATALFERAPALPRLDPFLCVSDEVLAHCTKDALRGGLFVGYLEMLKGLLSRFETRLGVPCPRLLTGGRAQTFAAAAPALGQVVPMLTLNGIRLLLRRRLASV